MLSAGESCGWGRALVPRHWEKGECQEGQILGGAGGDPENGLQVSLAQLWARPEVLGSRERAADVQEQRQGPLGPAPGSRQFREKGVSVCSSIK